MPTVEPADVLPEIWRLPFELAWEAFRAGSRPVGAVLLDARDRVVAAGRNRSQESTAPAGQLAGAAIAHAEINVLAQLSARQRYADHRLFTTLEPCLLCSSALINAHVGTVVYAASDVLWRGVEEVPRVGGIIAARWARREGPAGGPLSVFGAVLMDLWSVLDAQSTGASLTRNGGCGFLALAGRCLEVDGLLDAETAEAAYQLLLPYLAVAQP